MRKTFEKLLIIADGMADKRYEELGGLSPIEAAFTPFWILWPLKELWLRPEPCRKA